MDPQERRLLEKIAELTRRNQVILKKLHRAQVIGRTFHILYWVLIIGTTIGAFYFLQPYIDQLKSIYAGIQDTFGGLQNLLDGIGGGSPFLEGVESIEELEMPR